MKITLPPGYLDLTFGQTLSLILTYALAIGAVLALFYLIWGAFGWITSGGDKSKIKDARGRIISAIVGLVLLAACWTILNIVLHFLGIENLDQLVNNVKPENFIEASPTPTPTPTPSPSPTPTPEPSPAPLVVE